LLDVPQRPIEDSLWWTAVMLGSFPALGEIEGIDLTLTFLRDKRAEAHRIQQREPIHLGLPAVGPWNGS
jgi:hypothetical protein